MQTWEQLHRQSGVPNAPQKWGLGILYIAKAPSQPTHISFLKHYPPPNKDLLEEDRSVNQVKRPRYSSWLQLFFFSSIPVMTSAPNEEGEEK